MAGKFAGHNNPNSKKEIIDHENEKVYRGIIYGKYDGSCSSWMWQQ